MAMDSAGPITPSAHLGCGLGVGSQARTLPGCGARSAWVTVVTTCLAVWLLMRVVFFVGFAGSDDLFLLRYAMFWDRTPVNGWEARILGNALTAASIRVFGYSQVAAALPSLVASLTVLACVLAFCRRLGDVRSAWWAGLLAAVLPVEVDMATSISPHMIMSAWMAIGTLAFLRAPESARAKYAAALCLSLGVVTHLAGLYYVASLAIASLWVDHRRYLIPTVTTALVGVAMVAIDVALFHFVFGDAFLRFRLGVSAVAHETPIMPTNIQGGFNPEFVLWPIRNLLFSKAFGVSLVVVLTGAWWIRRRLDASARILLITVALSWIWMSFGSAVPWAYHPFERIMRYLQPCSLAVVLLFAIVVTMSHYQRFSKAAGSAVLAICVLNLLGSGSWDQNTHVSSELLSYVHRHPQMRFVTDYHTLNEMYAANGMKTVPNVATTEDIPRSRLLDRQAALLVADGADQCDAILVNPLNLARTPEFASYVRRHGGRLRFETKPTYRRICLLFPWLSERPWALRKPPAQVFECKSPGPTLPTDAAVKTTWIIQTDGFPHSEPQTLEGV